MRYNPIETFLQEAEELLADIEQGALSLGAGEQTADTIHQLFRAFHTIKGSGAMVGLDSVAAFTHHVESLLDQAREGAVEVSDTLVDLVLKSRDRIKLLLVAEQGGPPVPPESTAALIEAVEALATTGAPTAAKDKVAPVQEPAKPAAGGPEGNWQIRFRPNPALLACGGNPVALLKELRELGPCEVTAHFEEVPSLDEIQPDRCYLWWTIALQTAASANSIRDVFIFVEDGSQLEIESLRPAPSQTPAAEQQAASAPVPADQPNSAAPPAAARAPIKALARESTVRVPAERLDRLVNLVGELVMNQSRLARAASQSGAPEFANPVQELDRLVTELRDNVLGIRMLPIGTLFGRFRRLVHDLSAELGKEVELVTEGAETELDKSILDQLGEPLVHCLRNCLDHGFEPPEDRAATGKPRLGTIRLSAVHTGSDVVISIQDDGRGIDKAAVLAKAIEKQLVAPDASLSDKDVFNLILLPGFSTAREVTNVSGRGVGMDAVKRQIDALRGSLSLQSEAGMGTRISITLPLTLAIIEGLLVELGRDQYIIPMAMVTENVELIHTERARHNRRNVIAVRGELVPYIDLRQAFGVDSEVPAIEKVVIVQHEGDRVGLVVDRVLGTHQTVIQSLGKFFRSIDVVSGATIMGDGRVALIMDISAVVRFDGRQASPGVAWAGAELAVA
jgi:two-component system, chemotaxis family, sensor kinase CheA